MDNKKDSKIPYCGNLTGIPGTHLVVGAKQLRKAVGSHTARCVYLAENADPAITAPLAETCTQNHIPVVWVHTMAELGRRGGIEVGAAAAALVSD